MDIQEQLNSVEEALKQRQISHARRLLKVINEISNDRFVISMLKGAINDINHACFNRASRDIHTARILDERNNFSIQL